MLPDLRPVTHGFATLKELMCLAFDPLRAFAPFVREHSLLSTVHKFFKMEVQLKSWNYVRIGKGLASCCIDRITWNHIIRLD